MTPSGPIPGPDPVRWASGVSRRWHGRHRWRSRFHRPSRLGIMSDDQSNQSGTAPGDDGERGRNETPEVVMAEPAGEEQAQSEGISEPAKVMRIGAMIRQLLEEVRQAPLDEAGRDRLRSIYDTSIEELSGALSPELAEELERITSPFDGGAVPSEAELRVAQAQLVGWLEGLFHGIQAALFAQQMAARQQLAEMRQQALPSPPGQAPPAGPGVYL